jgi:hypothetical protein
VKYKKNPVFHAKTGFFLSAYAEDRALRAVTRSGVQAWALPVGVRWNLEYG